MFQLSWDVPFETGAGNVGRFQDPTNIVRGNVRKIGNYALQSTPVPPGETSIHADFNNPINIVATSPLEFATKTDVLIGFVYHFRVAAINQVGRGPWSTVTTSGPEVDRFEPHRGAAMGGFKITVWGVG